jgi:hypothetical protein
MVRRLAVSHPAAFRAAVEAMPAATKLALQTALRGAAAAAGQSITHPSLVHRNRTPSLMRRASCIIRVREFRQTVREDESAKWFRAAVGSSLRVGRRGDTRRRACTAPGCHAQAAHDRAQEFFAVYVAAIEMSLHDELMS